MREFGKTIENIVEYSASNPSILNEVEGILLHIHAREISGNSSFFNLKLAIASLLINFFLEFVAFLVLPFSSFLKFAFCILVALLCPEGFKIIGYIITYFITNFQNTTNYFRGILYDLLEFISLGNLSKIFAKSLVYNLETCKRFTNDSTVWYIPEPIARHFHRSRQPQYSSRLISGTNLSTLKDMFMNLVQLQADEKEVKNAIEQYKKSFRDTL